MRTFARLVKALFWIGVFLILFGGIATALVLLVGWPLPDHWPTTDEWLAWFTSDGPINDRTLIDGFACAMWLLWGLSLGYLIVATVREIRLPRLQISVRRQGMVSGLVGAIVLGASRAAAAHTGGDTITPATPGTTTTAIPATDTDQMAKPTTYTVHSGDTLWDIAEEQTGNPLRYKQIAADNDGRIEPDGRRFTDPDLIYPGWTLEVPDDTPTDPPAQNQPQHHAHPHTPTPSPTETPTAPHQRSSPHAPPAAHDQEATNSNWGVGLPSGTWIGAGLAAAIAMAAALIRVQRRRRARLSFPIPTNTEPAASPVPDSIIPADTAGTPHLTLDADSGLPVQDHAVAVPLGTDATGHEISLYDLTGPTIALTGPGARPAARAVLASALSTGLDEPEHVRPLVVTTPATLSHLLPPAAPTAGLDPDHTSLDPERLIVMANTAEAITHAEEETLHRRRLLDDLDTDSVNALNARDDHAEHQPPYLLLVDADAGHAARIAAIDAHRERLHLHPVILGTLDSLPSIEIDQDGRATLTADGNLASPIRFATLTATELCDVLALLAQAMPRVEPQPDAPTAETSPFPEAVANQPPVPDSHPPAPVRLQVLGPVTITTDSGRVTKGVRSGSYAVLAILAAHPDGRTLDQLAGNIYPEVLPVAAIKRIRTAITTTRRILRAATGQPHTDFLLFDPAISRYRIDPDSITVDLWQMLTALHRANNATTDTDALTALREATDLYNGDFADGHDWPWTTDYTTTYRHHILNAHARIAEILETDQPDAAIAALEHATTLDPINEELYQRIMRIQGRQHRPDAVRRTLHRLEQRLADLDTEPSDSTCRLADRQIRRAAESA